MSGAKKRSEPTMMYGRPIVYDRDIFIDICSKLIRGQDLQEICAKPPMPMASMVLGWIQDHEEAREIDRSAQNFKSDRERAKKLNLPMLVGSGEWAEQVRANCERRWPADYVDRGYLPPDWSKVFAVIGDPPQSSRHNMAAYTDLLNAFTQMLEPRDLMELIRTKEATDADWEARRIGRKRGEWLERTLNRGFKPDYKNYRALDIAYTRAIKRRDNALRQIERWRKGPGAKSRRLEDRFLDEQVLAQRYREQFLVIPDDPATTGEAQEALHPVATAAAGDSTRPASARPSALAVDPAHDVMEAKPPPIASSDEAVNAGPQLAPADEVAQRAGPLRHKATDAAPLIANSQPTVKETLPFIPSDAGANGAPVIAPQDENLEPASLLARASGAMDAGAVETAVEAGTMEAGSSVPGPDAAAERVPLPDALPGQIAEAPCDFTPVGAAVETPPSDPAKGCAVEARFMVVPSIGAANVTPMMGPYWARFPGPAINTAPPCGSNPNQL